MATVARSTELAVQWIEAWRRMDLDWLRQNLAPDFVHVSPFGRLEGREHYLCVVEPMARKSVVELEVVDAIGADNQAAVRFENRTPNGVVESCDWIRIANGQIVEIRSFYDSAVIREVLSPDEQSRLENTP